MLHQPASGVKTSGYTFQVNPGAVLYHQGGIEGDNGVSRRWKKRSSAIGSFLSPRLRSADCYNDQRDWSRSLALGREYRLKNYWPAVAYRLVIRLARMARNRIRQSLKLG